MMKLLDKPDLCKTYSVSAVVYVMFNIVTKVNDLVEYVNRVEQSKINERRFKDDPVPECYK